ncbi:hypothetical protein D0815_03360 [Vibrio parahaemolyticus]|nr:hypothetical protein [Vibrio parahaemolyticus]
MLLYFRIWIRHSYFNKRERTKPLYLYAFKKE